MRALAEFIMRGRTQAAVVALLGIPLISAAALALVTLRRGARDGFIILLWALLPLVVILLAGLSPAMVLLASVGLTGLIATFAVALLLRSSASWPQLLMGLVALSALAALLLASMAPALIDAFTQLLGEAVQQLQVPEGAILHIPGDVFVVGWAAYGIASISLYSLLLARWWQALLYNPGGFQTEFHQLRLKPSAAIASLVATAYCLAVGGDYQLWGSLFMLPLLLTGIAIVHRVVAAKRAGVQWLVLFYMALVLFNPISMVAITTIAFLDTWLNFRGRLQEKP